MNLIPEIIEKEDVFKGVKKIIREDVQFGKGKQKN